MKMMKEIFSFTIIMLTTISRIISNCYGMRAMAMAGLLILLYTILTVEVSTNLIVQEKTWRNTI